MTTKVISIAVIAAIAATIGISATYRIMHRRDLPSTVANREWPEFTNTKYKYRLSHPPSALASKVEEMESGEPEESANIAIGIPGGSELGHIIAWDASSSLSSFANDFYSLQTENGSQSSGSRVKSNLKHISFGAGVAYRFSLAESLAVPGGGGYGLSDGIHEVTILEHHGVKLMLVYPAQNRLSKGIVDSLELF